MVFLTLRVGFLSTLRLIVVENNVNRVIFDSLSVTSFLFSSLLFGCSGFPSEVVTYKKKASSIRTLYTYGYMSHESLPTLHHLDWLLESPIGVRAETPLYFVRKVGSGGEPVVGQSPFGFLRSSSTRTSKHKTEYRHSVGHD